MTRKFDSPQSRISEYYRNISLPIRIHVFCFFIKKHEFKKHEAETCQAENGDEIDSFPKSNIFNQNN